MARPLRIEYPDATYHVTSRGNRQQPIFSNDEDRFSLLQTIAQGFARHDAFMWAYCLMGNHYHFVVQTRQANLSSLMHWVNGKYAQGFNRRHGNVGHLFQGRFHAVHVDRESYLLELCRYVELNPVRAGLVDAPDAWFWSSYRSHVGQAPVPDWLGSDVLHALLTGDASEPSRRRLDGGSLYASLVAAAQDPCMTLDEAPDSLFLGHPQFVDAVHGRASDQQLLSKGIPARHRAATHPLSHWLATCATRDEALLCAHRAGMRGTEMARALGLSPSQVSRLMQRARQRASAGDRAIDSTEVQR